MPTDCIYITMPKKCITGSKKKNFFWGGKNITIANNIRTPAFIKN